MNPLHPRHMTNKERLKEVCRILGLGLVRLKMRQSSQLAAASGESSLHFPPDGSGHANPKRRRTA
jgi:hypothetical protein